METRRSAPKEGAPDNSRGRVQIPPADAEVPRRAVWYIQLRWYAVIGTLIAVIITTQLVPQILPVSALLGTTGFIGVYNLLFHFYARTLDRLTDPIQRMRRSIHFVHLQVALDLLALTVLLHFSGGVENPFWALYVLHVVLASIVLSPPSAYAYAGLAAVLYGGMIGLEYIGVLPHVHLNVIAKPGSYAEPLCLLAVGTAFISTLFFAAWMVTSVSTRLRRRDAELMRLSEELAQRAEELSTLNRRLEDVDEARKRFVRVAAHELRAPVAAIQSYIRLILSGYVPPEKQEEILSRIEQRALELLDRINDLLVLSRIQERAPETKEIHLPEVLEHVLELMRGAAQEKHIRLTAEIEPDIPPIVADRDHMQRLWMNLISNAINYTPEWGSVEVALTLRPTTVRGSVQDTGIGIAPEDQDKIFQEFYRTEEAKKLSPHGTGLGLSIVKQIVEAYGGRIWVSSDVGKGAKFTFVLPRGDVPSPAGELAGTDDSPREAEPGEDSLQ